MEDITSNTSIAVIMYVLIVMKWKLCRATPKSSPFSTVPPFFSTKGPFLQKCTTPRNSTLSKKKKRACLLQKTIS